MEEHSIRREGSVRRKKSVHASDLAEGSTKRLSHHKNKASISQMARGVPAAKKLKMLRKRDEERQARIQAEVESWFEKFDENKDGYLEKAEMAVLIKKVFAAAKWIPSGKLEFRYFAIYGRGSPGRAMLSHAGKQFEDIGENPPTWPNNKPNAPYNGGSLPIVVLPDGKVLR